MSGLMVLGQDLGRFNTDLTILCVRDRAGQKFIKSVSIKYFLTRVKVASRGYDLLRTVSVMFYTPPH